MAHLEWHLPVYLSNIVKLIWRLNPEMEVSLWAYSSFWVSKYKGISAWFWFSGREWACGLSRWKALLESMYSVLPDRHDDKFALCTSSSEAVFWVTGCPFPQVYLCGGGEVEPCKSPLLMAQDLYFRAWKFMFFPHATHPFSVSLPKTKCEEISSQGLPFPLVLTAE